MKDIYKTAIILSVLAAMIGAIAILAASPIPIHALFGLAVLFAVLFVLGLKRRPHKAARPERVHFPGLNGLRFFAAFFVVIHHIEQIKMLNGFDTLYADPFWGAGFLHFGELGVTFFFVLSGFLITYLLMVELRDTGSICLKDFYTRRALRIWPLYFLLTFLSFFVFPHLSLLYCPNRDPVVDANFWPKFALFMLMLVHIGGYPSVQYAGVLWSASVEEHFYFIWPFLVRALKKRAILALLLFVPVLAVLKQILYIRDDWIDPHASMTTLLQMKDIGGYFKLFRIDCMAIGGMGAWLCLQKSRVLPFLFHRGAQIVLGVVLAYCLVRGTNFGPVDDDVYAVLFLIVVLNVAVNPKSLLKLEHTGWDFLGKISYGLYAYNWVAVVIVINLMRRFGVIENVGLRNLYIYAASLALLVGLSSASYFLMERKFLRLKRRFGSLSKSGMDPVSPAHPAAPVASLSTQ